VVVPVQVTVNLIAVWRVRLYLAPQKRNALLLPTVKPKEAALLFLKVPASNVIQVTISFRILPLDFLVVANQCKNTTLVRPVPLPVQPCRVERDLLVAVAPVGPLAI